MKITRTTTFYALRRGLVIEPEDYDGIIFISIDDDCSEPLFSLIANEDGSASYHGNIWLPKDIKEEIPAHYRTENDLRLMLDFVASELRERIVR